MDFPADFFVKPVDGHDDLDAFRFGFSLEAPEGKASTLETLDNGDLLIEGWAAVFEGLDREGENFAPGAFERGIASFLSSQAALCHHHKHDQVIGKVLDLTEVEGKGLKMKARVTKQEPSSPLYHIYNGIKKGDINGLSVGGFFKRGLTGDGPRIVDCDFTEISTTGVPVKSGTNFDVIAGKALADMKLPKVPKVDGEVREDDVFALIEAVAVLERTFARIEARGKKKKEQPKSAVSETIDALSA